MKFYLINKKSLKENYNIEISQNIWNYKFNTKPVHQVLNSYFSNIKRGVKSQKNYKDISGSGIKPWKQKGTGKSRAGNSRSSIWRGGAVSFALRNKKNIQNKINKKMYIISLRSILSELIRNNRLFIVKNLDIKKCETRIISNISKFNKLKNLLIISHNYNKNLFLSCRNIPNISVILYNFINPLILIKYQNILLTLLSFRKIEKNLRK